jgi:co-chaperonin GroES (HSP10)
MSALRAEDIAEQAAAWDATDVRERPSVFMPKTPVFNALGIGNVVEYLWSDMDEAFPAVDPGHEPLGALVLCMMRQPPLRTKAGSILPAETRQTEHYNTQVAKVIAIGPNAFQNRTTGEAWPEGAWVKPGDFVRLPKYQGDRWTVTYKRTDFNIDPSTGAKTGTYEIEDEVVFVMLKDLSLLAKVKDPLAVKAIL